MKADYVHKDSKTLIDETISYKITMPLINNEELQRIDNHYNELVDEFIKQFVKEKDMIIAQRIMMNLHKENEQLQEENQKYKETFNKIREYINGAYEMAIYTKNIGLEEENIEDLLEILNEVE